MNNLPCTTAWTRCSRVGLLLFSIIVPLSVFLLITAQDGFLSFKDAFSSSQSIHKSVWLSNAASNDKWDLNFLSLFYANCDIHDLTRIPPRHSAREEESQEASGKPKSVVRKALSETHCRCPRVLRLAPFTIPTTGFLSFPGSGNTWMRHLLQQMTGIYAGSIYSNFIRKPKIKPNKKFLEGQLDNVIVVKTHVPPNADGFYNIRAKGVNNTIRNISLQFDRMIILFRNPYHSLVSEFKRSRLKLGFTRTSDVKTSSRKWTSWLEQASKDWKEFVLKALDIKLPSLILFYEDLTKCLGRELFELAKFLSSSDLNKFAFCCVLTAQQEGGAHRPPSNQTYEEIYPTSTRKLINGIILSVIDSVKEQHPEVSRRFQQYIMPV